MILFCFILIAILIFIDQLTKYFALVKLQPIHSIEIISGFLDFTYVENRGAAFGILQGQKILLLIITFVISFFLIFYILKLPKIKLYNNVRLACSLIVSGAIGNAIDRMFRGFVVDFLEVTFISWPVFNLADIFVIVGAVWFSYQIFYKIEDDSDFIFWTKKE